MTYVPSKRRFSGHDKRIVAARQQWCCAICGQMLDETYHIDHIIPLHRGGADLLENAQALCVHDHAKKTVAEEAERLRRKRVVRPGTRAPVVCTACSHVLSPYFAAQHVCPSRVRI